MDVEVHVGCHLDDVICESIALATVHDCTVGFKFNGKMLVVNKRCEVDKVRKKYFEKAG